MVDIDKIDLHGIADALADNNDWFEHHTFVNPDTGEIVFWTADTGIDGQTPMELDELDEMGLIAIDPLPSYVWYQDMVDFVDEVSDERAQRRLARAIDGRGAFRRFRIELEEEYPHLQSVWRAFENARAMRRAIDWLLDNELVDQETADQARARYPDPAVP